MTVVPWWLPGATSMSWFLFFKLRSSQSFQQENSQSSEKAIGIIPSISISPTSSIQGSDGNNCLCEVKNKFLHVWIGFFYRNSNDRRKFDPFRIKSIVLLNFQFLQLFMLLAPYLQIFGYYICISENSLHVFSNM